MPKKQNAAQIITQLVNKAPVKIPLPEPTKLETPRMPAMSQALLERMIK